MNIIKIILIAVGLLAVILLGSWAIGLFYSLLWYLVAAGVLVLAGVAGYKFLKRSDDTAQIEGKQTVVIREMDNAERTLEEYKRKYLPK